LRTYFQEQKEDCSTLLDMHSFLKRNQEKEDRIQVCDEMNRKPYKNRKLQKLKDMLCRYAPNVDVYLK